MILAIALLLVAATFFGYPRVMAHEAAARRRDFIEQANAGNKLVGEAKFAEAAPVLEKVLANAPKETFPELLATYANLAGAETALGHLPAARKVVADAEARMAPLPETTLADPAYKRERVRLITTSANILLAQGKPAEATALYQRAVNVTPEDAAAHANLANAFFLQGEYRLAEDQFELAVARQPDNAETLNNWGILLLNTKRPEEAEEKFRAAARLNPKGAKYYYGLGLALRAQHRPGPALVAEKAAISFNPNMIQAFLEIADLYFELKDYHEAESYLRASLKLDRNNMQAILALARLLAQTDDLGQRDYLESATLFQQALDLSKGARGQDVNLLTQLSDMYALAGVPEKAESVMSQALQRARKENVSAADMELMRQHALADFFLHCGPPPKQANPESTLGSAFGANPATVDPLDNPPEETPKPFKVRIVPIP